MPKVKKQFDGKNEPHGEYEKPPLWGLIYNQELDFLKDLLFNSVKIENLSFTDEFFVKTQLFETGYVGYSDTADKFLRTLPEKTTPQTGRLWTNGQFYTPFNRSLGVHAYAYYKEESDAWRILLARPSKTTLLAVLETYASLLADCRIAIKQNINAVKSPAYWVTNDEDLALSIKTAIQDTLDGDSAVVVKKNISAALSGMRNETPYVADKIHQEYREILNEVLTRVGIMTANTSKRERVQSAEVNATLGQSIDSIYTIIDFWNKQIDSYGLPYQMSLNGSIEELYEDGEETDPLNK